MLENLTDDGHLKHTPEPMRVGEAHDELAATIEELPAMPTSEVVVSTPEDRRQEIDDLRANLGLRIEEPALAGEAQAPDERAGHQSGPRRRGGRRRQGVAQGREPFAGHAGRGGAPTPLVAAHRGAQVRAAAGRPVSARPSHPRPGESPVHGSASIPEPPVRPRVSLVKIVRIAVVVALLVAATVVAIVFVK